MRWIVRTAVAVAVALALVMLFVFDTLVRDSWHKYNVNDFVYSSVAEALDYDLDTYNPTGENTGDKIVIMAKLEAEDTEWVAEKLPEYVPFLPLSLAIRPPPPRPATDKKILSGNHSWQHAIYTVNPTSPTQLSTPLNKGHESMAYLSYIIDNYSTLPRTLAFLHSHRSGFFTAWHTDAALHDNVHALRALQIPFVQQNGYVNLRCNWNPGCKEAHRYNAHVTPDIWRSVFEGTSTSWGNNSASSSPISYKDDAPSDYFQQSHRQTRSPPSPQIEKVGAACCAQFAVSRDRVWQRPLSDYEQFRQWVVDTKMDDAKSGRVMEFLWHVIFGMDAV